MDLAAGMRLGKYELGKELGRGGFGMVFVARDSELDRPCALKFLLAEHTANPELLRRFLKEARTAAKIGHLGIVTVVRKVNQARIPSSSGKRLLSLVQVGFPT